MYEDAENSECQESSSRFKSATMLDVLRTWVIAKVAYELLAL